MPALIYKEIYMRKINAMTLRILLSLSIISAILSFVIFKEFPIRFNLHLLPFTIFAIIIESLVIFTPNKGGVTLTFGIVLSVAVLFGPSEGLLCAIASILFSIYKMEGEVKHLFNIPWYKTLGNINAYIISSGLSSLLFIYLNQGLEFKSGSIISMFISGIVFILMDVMLITSLMIVSSQANPILLFKENFRGVIPNFFGLSAVSIVIVMSYLKMGIEMVLILFFPYMLIRYSFKLVYDMQSNYLSTIKALSSALEEKDPYTRGHSERVEKYSIMIANEIGHSKVDMQQLQYAAIFHDIGKIGVEDSILYKPGKLTKEEYEAIKQHPQKSVNILEGISFLNKAITFIASHHEGYDGTGYPNRLKREEIPLESKIISVADIYDALTTDRPYRKAMTNRQAIDIIKEESGQKLDPFVVEKFLVLYDKGRFKI